MSEPLEHNGIQNKNVIQNEVFLAGCSVELINRSKVMLNKLAIRQQWGKQASNRITKKKQSRFICLSIWSNARTLLDVTIKNSKNEYNTER